MLKTQILCDLCKKPFPTEIKETEFGPIEVIKGLSKTKVWDTQISLPHLCECCALKIDNALLQLQNDMIRDTETGHKKTLGTNR